MSAATKRWFSAAYRAQNGNVIPVGAENVVREYASSELAEWVRDDPDGTYFLAYRDVPAWREVG